MFSFFCMRQASKQEEEHVCLKWREENCYFGARQQAKQKCKDICPSLQLENQRAGGSHACGAERVLLG